MFIERAGRPIFDNSRLATLVLSWLFEEIVLLSFSLFWLFQIVFDDILDTSGGPIRGITQDFSTGINI
jgi:hypothetical protein